MNGLRSKILVGLSLAVIVMLAVPLGLMAASVIRGESPRQMAEKEDLDDAAADSGDPDSGNQEDSEADLDGMKPEVQPDPGPAMPPPPVIGTAEDTEDTEEPEPAPAADTGKKQSSAKKTKPKTQKTQTPKASLPKAVLGPNEAPCMVDGLDGYAYDYQ